MIGNFVRRLAVETPDGDNTVFNAPLSWGARTLYVVRNGVVQWRGFSFIGGTQIQFDVAPEVGEVIEFLFNDEVAGPA